MTAYARTTWVNGTTPAINATDLNNLTNELKLQAATSPHVIANTLPTWTNGSGTAISDAAPLNEMERVTQLVQQAWGAAAYTKTVWGSGLPWPGNPARNATNLNHLEAQAVLNRTAIDAVAPPVTRSIDLNFAADSYYGEGITTILCAANSSPNTPNGFQDAANYTALGMTNDLNMRVHLIQPTNVGLPANPQGGNYASWQELRTTDGPLNSGAGSALAKATIESGRDGSLAGNPNVGNTYAWGPSGWIDGAVRWFAWDILFPLNISGASSPAGSISFEFVNTWHTIFDLHTSVDFDDDPCLGDITGAGNLNHAVHPKWLSFTQTPSQSVPYISIPMLQLTNADGSRKAGVFNVWHEIIVGGKFARDASGWYELWVNGAQVAPQTSRPAGMVGASDVAPYIQGQNYTSWPTSFIGGATRGAIVYGGIRAGANRSDVQTR